MHHLLLRLPYAWRHSASYDLVWWLRAEDGSTLASDYAALATELELPEKDEQEQAVTILAVKKRLDQISNWLLIFDNARDSESIQRFAGMKRSGLRGCVCMPRYRTCLRVWNLHNH